MNDAKIKQLILRPLDNTHLHPNAHGELRYELEGDTVLFVFNGYGLVPGTYYGLYCEGNLLGLSYAVESGKVNLQGFRPREIMEGCGFRLYSLDMSTIRPLSIFSNRILINIASTKVAEMPI